MVTRIRMRTPRRRKVWAHSRHTAQTGELFSAAGVKVMADLLEGLQSDIGVSRLSGLTVMRIVGRLELGQASSASVSGYVQAFWGIAWVPDIVAGQTSGDSALPDPMEQGEREVQWLQRGMLTKFTDSSVTAGATNQPGALVDVDITQMRKQPTVSHQLCLFGRTLAPGSTDPALWWSLNTMVALP